MRALLLATVVAAVHTPTLPNDRTEFPVIDAGRGHVVWSDWDAAVRRWRLVEY
jgi:hypothetical protein